MGVGATTTAKPTTDEDEDDQETTTNKVVDDGDGRRRRATTIMMMMTMKRQQTILFASRLQRKLEHCRHPKRVWSQAAASYSECCHYILGKGREEVDIAP